jgi:hypothetical protein
VNILIPLKNETSECIAMIAVYEAKPTVYERNAHKHADYDNMIRVSNTCFGRFAQNKTPKSSLS